MIFVIWTQISLIHYIPGWAGMPSQRFGARTPLPTQSHPADGKLRPREVTWPPCLASHSAWVAKLGWWLLSPSSAHALSTVPCGLKMSIYLWRVLYVVDRGNVGHKKNRLGTPELGCQVDTTTTDWWEIPDTCSFKDEPLTVSQSPQWVLKQIRPSG